MQELNDTATNWQTARIRLDAMADTERGLRESLELSRTQENELLLQQNEALETDAHLVRQIADVDREQSELRQLLLQFRGHVRDGICPLCGEDHGSTDVLLRRIESRLSQMARARLV